MPDPALGLRPGAIPSPAPAGQQPAAAPLPTTPSLPAPPPAAPLLGASPPPEISPDASAIGFLPEPDPAIAPLAASPDPNLVRQAVTADPGFQAMPFQQQLYELEFVEAQIDPYFLQKPQAERHRYLEGIIEANTPSVGETIKEFARSILAPTKEEMPAGLRSFLETFAPDTLEDPIARSVFQNSVYLLVGTLANAIAAPAAAGLAARAGLAAPTAVSLTAPSSPLALGALGQTVLQAGTEAAIFSAIDTAVLHQNLDPAAFFSETATVAALDLAFRGLGGAAGLALGRAKGPQQEQVLKRLAELDLDQGVQDLTEAYAKRYGGAPDDVREAIARTIWDNAPDEKVTANLGKLLGSEPKLAATYVGLLASRQVRAINGPTRLIQTEGGDLVRVRVVDETGRGTYQMASKAEARRLADRARLGEIKLAEVHGDAEALGFFADLPKIERRSLPEAAAWDLAEQMVEPERVRLGDMEVTVLFRGLSNAGRTSDHLIQLPTGERLIVPIRQSKKGAARLPRALDGLAVAEPPKVPMRVRDIDRIMDGLEVLEGTDGTRLVMQDRGDGLARLVADTGETVAETRPQDVVRLVQRGALKVWEPPAKFASLTDEGLRNKLRELIVTRPRKSATAASGDVLDAWRELQRRTRAAPDIEKLRLYATTLGVTMDPAKPGRLKFKGGLELDLPPGVAEKAARSKIQLEARRQMFERTPLYRDIWSLNPDVDTLLPGAPGANEEVGELLKYVLEQNKVLQAAGSQGQRVAQRFLNHAQEFEQMQVRAFLEIDRILDGLTDQEMLSIADFIEKGTPTTERAASAARQLQALKRETFDELARLGAPVATDLGLTHFPRNNFNLEAIEKVGSAERAEAIKALGSEEKLKAWLRQQRGVRTNRKSGASEFERLGVPGYTKDPRLAFQTAITQDLRRVSEIRNFGLDSTNLMADLTEMGTGAQKFGIELLDQVLGNQRTELGATATFVHDLLNIRLTGTPLLAMTEPGKVWVRTGGDAFFKALALGARDRKDLLERAAWVGAFMPRTLQAEAGNALGLEKVLIPDLARTDASNAVARGVKRAGSTVAGWSGWVDNHTRALAAEAGGHAFDSLLARLVLDGADDFAVRELKSAGLNPATIIRAIGEANADVLAGMRGKYQKFLSDSTVFTVRPLDRPRFAQSAAGRLMFRYKQFAIAQARFMWTELNAWRTVGGEAGRRRTLRALGLITLGNPAAAAAVIPLRDVLGAEEEPTLPELGQLLQDKGVLGYLEWQVSANAALGTFGFFGDLSAAVATGRADSISQIGRPVALSALQDTILIGYHASGAIMEQDSARAVKAGERIASFGGAPVRGLFRRATRD